MVEQALAAEEMKRLMAEQSPSMADLLQLWEDIMGQALAAEVEDMAEQSPSMAESLQLREDIMVQALAVD